MRVKLGDGQVAGRAAAVGDTRQQRERGRQQQDGDRDRHKPFHWATGTIMRNLLQITYAPCECETKAAERADDIYIPPDQSCYESMATVTLAVPEELKKKMARHRRINWSEVACRAFAEKIRDLEFLHEFAAKSDLTEMDALRLGRRLNKRLAGHYA